MNGAINGFAYNGSAFPNWVVRAVVAATAAATVTAGGVRVAYGNVLADAAVVVTLTQTHVVAGRAQATAGANSATAPNIIYAGRSNTTANAIGLAAIRRDVFAFADADGTATGFALSSSKIGEAAGTASASLVSCSAHEILPGAVLGTVFATGAQASGLAIRYPTVLAQAGIEYTRAESRIQLNGQSIWRHDGFVPPGRAIASCSSSVPNDRMAIIATIGAFMFADATGTAKSNIKFPGAVTGSSQCTRITAVGSYLRAAAVSATAGATDTTVPIRTTQGAASGVGEASHLQLRPLVNYKGAVNALAEATLIQPVPCLRTAAARATANAEAYLATFTGYGTQHRGVVGALCGVSVSPVGAAQTIRAAASGQGEASLVGPTSFGTQNRATALTSSASTGVSTGTQTIVVFATGTALGVAPPAKFGLQAYAEATGAGGVSATTRVSITRYALAQATAGGTGVALGLANADVRAPDARYMTVPGEDRTMVVGFEERLMVAA